MIWGAQTLGCPGLYKAPKQNRILLVFKASLAFPQPVLHLASFFFLLPIFIYHHPHLCPVTWYTSNQTRAFPTAAPSAWNALPHQLSNSLKVQTIFIQICKYLDVSRGALNKSKEYNKKHHLFLPCPDLFISLCYSTLPRVWRSSTDAVQNKSYCTMRFLSLGNNQLKSNYCFD